VTITQVYKNRWHVELFFKWIKQHLGIKRFFVRTDNAVRSQIWITMCVYLLILIVKKRLGLDHSTYEILQILSVTVLLKEPFASLFLNNFTLFNNRYNTNQLLLFDLWLGASVPEINDERVFHQIESPQGERRVYILGDNSYVET